MSEIASFKGSVVPDENYYFYVVQPVQNLSAQNGRNLSELSVPFTQTGEKANNFAMDKKEPEYALKLNPIYTHADKIKKVLAESFLTN